jgi:ABC-type bacteriocin/lantibiotic exporter with double-glycine peptidase domain
MAMRLLDVPHLRQAEPGWCLPACVGMVTAYWQQPLLQDDVARWLGTREVGTPASRVRRLERRGFDIVYKTGSLSELKAWLAQGVPCIVFVHTGDLPYWQVDTRHAVVLVGLDATNAHLCDPGVDDAPVAVSIDAFMLAWSYSDYTYATLRVPAKVTNSG